MTCAVRLLSVEEYRAKEKARHDALDQHRREVGDELALPKRFYRSRWFEPGDAHFCPWYYNPANPKPNRMNVAACIAQAEANGGRGSFLSIHYLRNWADKRPPINVFCPNGREWLIDQCSSNGDGWTVSSIEPLNVAPSILLPGYHGFLQAGRLTADCDRPGHPNGVREDMD